MLLVLGACDRFRRTPAPAADAGAVRLPQTVTLPATEDRWTLSATLLNGTLPDRAVVLVHQLGSSRSEWAPLVQRLQRAPAVTTLAIDLRGHGASTRGPQGEQTTWESFGTDAAQWAGVVSDVDAALRFLSLGQFRRVALVGSSIGASACIAAASRSAMVDAVVMISPGLRYHGLDARGPLSVFIADPSRPRRVLLLGGDSDEPAAEALPALASLGVGRVDSALYGGERHHGVSLCNADPARWDRVEAFVREALDARRAQRASSTDAAAR